MLILPFIIFVCLITPITNYIADGLVGAIFYWFVTDKRYVAFVDLQQTRKILLLINAY